MRNKLRSFDQLLLFCRWKLSSLALLVFSLWPNLQLLAQDVTDDQKRSAADMANTEFSGLPLIFRTPETGLALGGVLLYTSGLDQKRPSPIISGLMYTEKKQILWGVGARKILPGQTSSLYMYSELAKFPQTFFGLGSNTRLYDASSYLEERQLLEFGGDYELLSHLSIGGGLILRNDHFISLEPLDKGLLGKHQFYGEEGGMQRGIQTYLLWESTDDNFFPSQGMKIQVFKQDYLKEMGSAYPFSAQKLDARFYQLLTPDWIQAHQIFIQNQNGNPSFYQLAQLGGNDILRGYYKGRYRDRKLIVLQSESRFRVSKYWNWVAFAGLGDVAHSWEGMTEAEIKPSIGSGVRYQISPQQKINVRLDIGWGQDQGGPQVYLYVMEAY